MSLNEPEWVWMSPSESESVSENGENRKILLHDRNQRYCHEHSQKLHTNEYLHAKGALMVWKPFQTGLSNKCWVRSFIANDKTDFFNKSPSFLKREACSSFQWDVVAWPIWGFLLHSKALIASPCWNYAAQKKETEQLLRKRNGSIIIDWMLALAQKICLALVMLTCQRSSLSDKSFGTNVQTKKVEIPPNS